MRISTCAIAGFRFLVGVKHALKTNDGRIQSLRNLSIARFQRFAPFAQGGKLAIHGGHGFRTGHARRRRLKPVERRRQSLFCVFQLFHGGEHRPRPRKASIIRVGNGAGSLRRCRWRFAPLRGTLRRHGQSGKIVREQAACGALSGNRRRQRLVRSSARNRHEPGIVEFPGGRILNRPNLVRRNRQGNQRRISRRFRDRRSGLRR